MEFSWQYSEAMRRLVNNDGYRALVGPPSDGMVLCPVMLTFDVAYESSEVPTMCTRIYENLLPKITEPGTVVIPMAVDPFTFNAAGAETILKRFARQSTNYGRLLKATTPKGEVYYGNNGIILDKNFDPLFLSTRVISCVNANGITSSRRRITKSDATIYLSPKVFTNDQGMLNKALAKKGIAFYLSQSISMSYWNNEDERAKVVIDDMSRFFKKVEKPDVNALSNGVFTEILKDNIDEVLSQFYNDMSRDN